MHWWTPLLVAVGSGVGGALRLFVYEVMRHWVPARPELGTLTVNIAGCMFAGALLAYLEPRGLYRSGTAGIGGISTVKALLIIGILGGFTTFSAFSLDTLIVVREGPWTRAAAYVVASTVGSLAMAALAFVLVRQFAPSVN